MNQNEETPRNYLILGGGALGLLLYQTLTSAFAQTASEMRILVHNRSVLREPILFSQGTQPAIRMSVEIDSGSPQTCLDALQPDIVFVCVPPEVTEEVSHRWLAALEDSRMRDKDVLFVFCSNGCLSSVTLTRLERSSSRFSFVRALFFVGAMRTLRADQTLVRWTGGTRVLWDWLFPVVGRRQQLPFFEPLGLTAKVAPQLVRASETGSSALGFTRWQREENIFVAERSKFFTNFMLAAAVGPQLAKNKTLSESLGDSIVSLQAQQFARLWEHHGVSAQDLKSTLLSTVAETGENINSLSFAAAQGNTATMAWFLSKLDEEIHASSRQAELEPLVAFLGSVRENWRMKK